MPLCLEKKIMLAGDVQTYSCELVRLERGFGILRYRIDREHTINGITLLPGDSTCALYWEDRPYTLYVWHLKRTGRVVYYFNIADSVVLSPGEFVWRDLVIDILIDDRGAVHVLDESELPSNLNPDLDQYIQEATRHVLAHYAAILEEVRTGPAGSCR